MTPELRFALMLRTMYETRRNKRYGRDSIDFEYNWAPLLVRMTNEMKTRTFRITRNYAFLTSYPKWREIFATEFQGRIADHLLCDTLNPYIERDLYPRTFNNRKGLGSSAAINQVIDDIRTVTEDYTRPARIIKWDLKGFFPNADLGHMCRMFHGVIDRHREEIAFDTGDGEMPDFLKWLAGISIHCRPQEHCELRSPKALWPAHISPDKSLFSKPPGKGAPIGRMNSQAGMCLYMTDDIRWLNEECGIRSTLFVDDCTMIVPEAQHAYALSLFPKIRERLAAKGVRLNERKFYDQPWQHGLEFLGSHIRQDRIVLNDRTWSRALDRIYEYNRLRNKYDYIGQFKSTVNSYTGILKNRTSAKRIAQLRDAIAPEWRQWLEWDTGRKCVISKPEASFRALLNSKYHLKIKHL